MAAPQELFRPGRIGKVRLKNRLIKGPETTYLADEAGYVTDTLIVFYVERAKGGAALLTIGVVNAFREAPIGTNYLSLYDESYVPGLQKLSDAIHRHEAKASLMLGHHGLSMAQPERLKQCPQTDIVGPSAVPYGHLAIRGREMNRADIRHIIDGFARAAAYARQAGFDAVEIHACHSSLLAQFRSPYFNKRTDEYGGSAENRARLACEVLSEVRRRVGAEMAVTMKINGEDRLEGGLSLEDTVIQAPLFETAGADALEVSAGLPFLSTTGPESHLEPMGTLVPLAEAVKRAVKIPVVASGRIDVPLAERVLQQGKADFIAMTRPLIADPHLPDKAKAGRLDDVQRCIYCNNCGLSYTLPYRQYLKGRGIACPVNPHIGNESRFTAKSAPAPKKIMVIGGGLAGMEAASILAGRGHQVSLYEKSVTLGGRWNIASQLKGRKEYAGLTKRLRRNLTQSGVKVVLGQEVDAEFVKKARPDIVIIATGALPAALNVPGVTSKKFVSLEDAISGKARLGAKVVVAGSLHPAMEVAYSLAGKCIRLSLVILRDLATVATMMPRHSYYPLRGKLIAAGVYIYPNAAIREISENGLALDYNNEYTFLEADTIVQATPGKPDNSLFEELKGIVPEVYAAGDCIEPRRAVEAMSEGAALGYRL